MDSDCLIKVTKSAMKEALTTAVETVVPRAVIEETVDAAPPGDSATAAQIERNLEAGRLRLRDLPDPESGRLARLAAALRGGERSVAGLYESESADAVATDDKRFTRLLRKNGVRVMSSGELLIYLIRVGAISEEDAIGMLGRLSGMIPTEQYMEVRRAIEDA